MAVEPVGVMTLTKEEWLLIREMMAQAADYYQHDDEIELVDQILEKAEKLGWEEGDG